MNKLSQAFFCVSFLSLPSLLTAQSASSDAQALQIQQEPAGAVLLESLRLGGKEHSVRLEPRSLRSANFQLWVEDARGLHREEPPRERSYRGKIWDAQGQEGDAIATMDPQGRLRLLVQSQEEWYSVEPENGESQDRYRAIRVRDLPPPTRGCGSDGEPISPLLAPPPISAGGGGGGSMALTAVDKVCKIAFDVDYDFYQLYAYYLGPTLALQYCVSHAEGVLAGAEYVYEGDCGISYELTTIVIRTAEPDPYSEWNSAPTLLAQFRNYWNANMGWVDRHVAHLITGKVTSDNYIGYAYIGGICNSNAYGLSEPFWNLNAPWAQQVGLVAHELGHNWNATHCSGSPCYLMCPVIGGCDGVLDHFSQGSINQILAYKATQSCLGSYAPPYAMDPPVFIDHFDATTLDSSLWIYNKGAAISTAASNEPSGTKSLCLNAAGAGANDDDEVRSNEMNIWNWDIPGAWPVYQPLSVSFSSEHVGVESGEDLVVEYFVPTAPTFQWLGGWRELGRVHSNGSDQTQFAWQQFSLPSNAYNWEFRVRLRPEVNQSNDNWYVDDFRIGPPLGPVAGAPGKVFAGTIPGEGLGSSVAIAGDVNGDGYQDYIAGSPYASQLPYYLNGKATIFSGKTGAVLRVLWGGSYEGQFGWSVAGAGDWNGDGFADVLVGEPGVFPSAGRALVISGADGATLFTIDGDTPEDRFGYSVARIGDVNGDGKADLAVGAPGPNNAYSTALGYARVFAGGTGAQLFSWSGTAALSFFGYSVASAGDVDHDGRPDIVIGAPKTLGNKGRVEVHSGATGALIRVLQGQFTGAFFGWAVDGIGDLDGDGKSEIAVGSPYESSVLGAYAGVVRVFKVNTGVELFALYGEKTSDNFGYSLAGVGDTNCDGKPELLVGAPQISGGAGYAMLFSGGADRANLTRFLGAANGDQLGRAVCKAGGAMPGSGSGGTLIGIPGADPSSLTGAGVAELRLGSACAATRVSHP